MQIELVRVTINKYPRKELLPFHKQEDIKMSPKELEKSPYLPYVQYEMYRANLCEA